MTGLLLGWHLAGPVGAFAALAGGPIAVETVLSRRIATDAVLLEGQLREAVAALGAALRAGLSVRRSLEEAARGTDSPLREHLQSVIHRMKMGEPPDVALSALTRQISLPDLRLLVNALSVDRRTGGNLPALLDEIGAVIAQRSAARREVRALTAQGRASGAVLAALPVAFVALLSGTGGDGLGAFYRTPLGSLLLITGLAFAGIGHLWIRRILARAEAAA
ncbi:MAG TPA: type II secretion system F family protein [Actinomycetota bacterium]|nr:type II secretion system F family protein [Actinomycetota bacterium]